MTENDDFWGEPIAVYSREMAFADGVLVDLNVVAPDICRQLFPTVSVACTAALWAVIQEALEQVSDGNDLNGIIWDVLWMSRQCVVGVLSEDVWLFHVMVKQNRKHRILTLKAEKHVCDDGVRPAITIMMRNED